MDNIKRELAETKKIKNSLANNVDRLTFSYEKAEKDLRAKVIECNHRKDEAIED